MKDKGLCTVFKQMGSTSLQLREVSHFCSLGAFEAV